MRPAAWVAVFALAAACDSPRAVNPSTIGSGDTVFPEATSLDVASFTATRRFVDGEFRYAPRVLLRETSGTMSAVVRTMSFDLQNSPVHSGRVVQSNQTIAPGGELEFGGGPEIYEFASLGESTAAFITVEYVDGMRRAGRAFLTGSVSDCATDRECAGDRRAAVKIVLFTLTPVAGQDARAVEPHLTVVEERGRSAATIERIDFIVYDGFYGPYVLLSVGGPWPLAAGSSVRLLPEGRRGRPRVVLTPDPGISSIEARVVYADDTGLTQLAVRVALMPHVEATRAP